MSTWWQRRWIDRCCFFALACLSTDFLYSFAVLTRVRLDVDADTVTDEHGLDVLVSEMPQPAEAKAADINNAALASTTDEATDEALVDYDGTVALNTTAEDSDAAHESGAAQARTTSQALTPETA